MWTLTELAFMGIAAAGFVTTDPKCAGEKILGLPIVLSEDLKDREDIVGVYGEDLPGNLVERLKDIGPFKCLPDMLEPDPLLGRGSLYILGAGQEGWELLNRFNRAGIAVRGFIRNDNDKEPGGELFGLPVLDREKIRLPEDAVIITCPLSAKASALMRFTLSGMYTDLRCGLSANARSPISCTPSGSSICSAAMPAKASSSIYNKDAGSLNWGTE